tara:strand:- start:6214 stop:6510 length:297 start_codon:yes stop_codon:yes gene_type:complete
VENFHYLIDKSIQKIYYIEMIIQSKTMNIATNKLRDIIDRFSQESDERLKQALREANEEGRDDILNSDKTDLEILNVKTQALQEALDEIQELVDSENE